MVQCKIWLVSEAISNNGLYQKNVEFDPVSIDGLFHQILVLAFCTSCYNLELAGAQAPGLLGWLHRSSCIIKIQIMICLQLDISQPGCIFLNVM